MGMTMDAVLDATDNRAYRIFRADTLQRLQSLNAVSRQLRALGFEVAAEELYPDDLDAPMLRLRAVSPSGQETLRGLVATTTLRANERSAWLDGVRLFWSDCAVHA